MLTRVAGRPMLDHLERLYRRAVDEAAVVAHPSFSADVRRRLAAFGWNATVAEQPEPTGVLDAILLAAPAVLAAKPDRVWITWCDQIAIRPETIGRMRDLEARDPDADVIMPTARARDPYTHVEIDDMGRVTGFLQRREGDTMPDEGLNDAGLFSLSRRAFLEDLRWFAGDTPAGAGTAQRNFVPFIVGRRVVSYPAAPIEATGVNTSEELALVEPHVRPEVSTVVAPDGEDRGRAVRDGIARATGDLILIQDAGPACGPEDLQRMLRALDEGADVVHRGGYRLYPRSLLVNMDLQSTGVEIDHEMTAKSIARGMKISREPGKKSGLKDWFRALKAFRRYGRRQ